MTALAWLVPCALALGSLGLAAFLWALRNRQFDDLDGAGWRALEDEGINPGGEMVRSDVQLALAAKDER